MISSIALNYIVLCFYTYSVKKDSFITVNIPIQEERKESLKCCLFGGNRGWWWKNHKILTRINKIEVSSRGLLSLFPVLLCFSPSTTSTVFSPVPPCVQTVVQDRPIWIYWFLHKLITLKQEYIRLNFYP